MINEKLHHQKIHLLKTMGTMIKKNCLVLLVLWFQLSKLARQLVMATTTISADLSLAEQTTFCEEHFLSFLLSENLHWFGTSDMNWNRIQSNKLNLFHISTFHCLHTTAWHCFVLPFIECGRDTNSQSTKTHTVHEQKFSTRSLTFHFLFIEAWHSTFCFLVAGKLCDNCNMFWTILCLLLKQMVKTEAKRDCVGTPMAKHCSNVLDESFHEKQNKSDCLLIAEFIQWQFIQTSGNKSKIGEKNGTLNNLKHVKAML